MPIFGSWNEGEDDALSLTPITALNNQRLSSNIFLSLLHGIPHHRVLHVIDGTPGTSRPISLVHPSASSTLNVSVLMSHVERDKLCVHKIRERDVHLPPPKPPPRPLPPPKKTPSPRPSYDYSTYNFA